MIRFGFFVLFFSVCLEIVVSQKPCDGVLGQQFRPDPSDCRVYYLCGQGKDWRLQCGPNTVWNQEIGSCVPVGSPEDKCTQGNKDPLPQKAPQGDPGARSPGTRHYSPFSESTWRPTCRPGSTKRFPHPTRCAQYYDCGADPKEDWWGKHLRECPYPTVYDTVTGSCEYYTTVNCGQRKMPLDPCDYLAQSCRNAHCAPCHIRYATCAGLPDGINTWRGRENTPFYVVCQAGRVAFHGRCINPEPGKRQIYDEAFHTCGRPVDFEMGLVHHMHRGEMGKSEIVKQIRHAKRVEQPPQSNSNNAEPPTGSQKTQQQQQQQQSKPHINQPQANQPPQQNTNNKPTNNQQPPAQSKTPKPHINQPQNQNNQQSAAAPPSNNAPQKQPAQHTPHINQPPSAPPQGKPHPPTGPATHHTNPPHTPKPAMPIQRTPHANQPQTQAPVNNPPPQQQQYQPPPQKPQYNPPPQRPPQNFGPPNRPPPAQYPPQQGPSSYGAQPPHVPQQIPPQRRGPPYNPPQSQNKPPPQNPNSLQTFINEMQGKMRAQPPNIPNPQINQSPPVQYPNLPQPQYTQAQPPSSFQHTVRAKPGRRPPRQQQMSPVQPPQHIPRQSVVPQPPIQRQAPHPHPNQQRQPYPQAPQVQPLPPAQMQHRPPTAPMTRPVHNVPQPIRHKNMPQIPNPPRPAPFPNSPPAQPIPYRKQGPPQPQRPNPRYPQPIQRAPSHGPQPIQKLPVGPYPQPQLYNEPPTVRQAIGQKHPPSRPTPPRNSQVGRAFQNNPFRREVVVADAKREKIADIKTTQLPAQQSIHSKSERAMERYTKHILGINEAFEPKANQQANHNAQQAEKTFSHKTPDAEQHQQQRIEPHQQHQSQHPNQPQYHQQQKTNVPNQFQNSHRQTLVQQQQQKQFKHQQMQGSFTHPEQKQPISLSNIQGFHSQLPSPTQQSNNMQHQLFQKRNMQQLMSVNPTQAYINPRFQTHQNAVGNSRYLQSPTPTVLSTYNFPPTTASTALLNNRFIFQNSLASSRLSQSAGPSISQSLSKLSQFAMSNVA